MKSQCLTFGHSQSRVVVIDGVSEVIEQVRELAAFMTPFPPAKNYYPGLRRLITSDDPAAYAYIEGLLQIGAPFIRQAFNREPFQMLEASFSMVTLAPDRLTANQRVPHFDDTDPNYLALLHYLGAKSGAGTAFYRHRATGIECVTAANVDALISVLKLKIPRVRAQAILHNLMISSSRSAWWIPCPTGSSSIRGAFCTPELSRLT